MTALHFVPQGSARCGAIFAAPVALSAIRIDAAQLRAAGDRLPPHLGEPGRVCSVLGRLARLRYYHGAHLGSQRASLPVGGGSP